MTDIAVCRPGAVWRQSWLLAACLGLVAPLPSAGQAATAEWSVYTSMREINALVQHRGQVWAATSGGVLKFDQETETYDRFTRLDGLAGNRVLSVAVDAYGHLWFGTDGRGLSRFRPEQGTFDPPVLDFGELRLGALVATGNRLYVGTERGISVFLIDRWEIKETYSNLGDLPKDSEVNALALSGGVLYAGAAEGMAWASLGQPNLQDPDSWTSTTRFGEGRDLVAAAGKVLAATRVGVAVFDPSTGQFVPDYAGEATTALGVLDGLPAAAGESGNFQQRSWDGVWTRVPAPIIRNVRALSKRGSGLWLATDRGLRHIADTSSGDPPPLREPPANHFYEMKRLGNGDLWVASVPNDFVEPFGVYQLNEDGWTVHDKASGMPNDDLVALETDAAGRLWVGSWGGGVAIRRSSQNWIRVDQRNSILRGIPKAPEFVVISDIARDGADNMWLVDVQVGIAVMDGYPATQSFLFDQVELGFPSRLDLNKIAFGPDGLKWVTSRTDGVVILDDGGTPFVGGDDSALLVSTAYDSRMSSNRVADLLIDAGGTIWIATDAGVNAVAGVYSRETRSFQVSSWRVYTSLDGLPSTQINDLEMDADGNIWIATDAGLSQIGADGEVAFTLTAANSGLIDNDVTSLLYDGAISELWIGTYNGLSRLKVRTGGTEGPEGLAVYPNPFFNHGSGRVTFSGLPLGSSLHIYAADGQLVDHIAGIPGRGSLSWRGQNEDGFLVGSGIYLFVAEDGIGNRVRGRLAVIAGSPR